MLSSLLNIAYLLPIPFHAFSPKLISFKTSEQLNNISEADEEKLPGFEIKEAPLPSLIAIVVTTLGCLTLFIYPQPLFDLASAILTGRG